MKKSYTSMLDCRSIYTNHFFFFLYWKGGETKKEEEKKEEIGYLQALYGTA